MKPIFLLLLLLGFLSCTSLENENSKNSEAQVSSESETEEEHWYSDRGFENEDGSYLKYFCQGENMFIEYGNTNFKRILKDTFYCNEYPSLPRLWSQNENFICLRFGCGSPYWGSLILPLNENDTVESYMFQYSFDEKRNILIYLDYEEEQEKHFIVAKNLKSKQTEAIYFEPCFNFGFMGNCIDSLNLENGVLYLQTIKNEEITEGLNSKEFNIIRREIKI